MLQSGSNRRERGKEGEGERLVTYVHSATVSANGEKWTIIICNKNLKCNMSSKMPVDH
jgi:hypothetical protein